MITEYDKEFIKENLKELKEIADKGFGNPTVMGYLKKRFPLDCWTCPRKIKMNVRNYINHYYATNRNTYKVQR